MNTRLSLGVAAVVLAATFAMATVALQLVKTGMQASIANEEFARVSALADAVDQKFVGRRTLLKTFGDSVESLRLANAAPLQAFLEQHTSLREAFDNVAFIDIDGNLVANLAGARQIGRVNLKDRAYFKDTVASRTGLISQPYRNRLNGLAQVAITEPVLDASGNVQFVISGSINLKERNILGELADVRFGDTGYLFITTTDGIVVDHPREERVLTQVRSEIPGDPEADRVIAGFEGTTEGIDRAGVPGLYAFKRIRQANWIMGARYPRNEAFARVDAIERQAWAGTVVLALLAGTVALVVVRRQLKPLTALHRRMLDAHAAPAEVAVPRSYAGDEIGDLSRTFDRLMRQRQASEKLLRDVTDGIPALVGYFDREENCLFGNSRARRMAGLGDGPLTGVTLLSAVGAEVYGLHAPHLPTVLAGKQMRFPIRAPLHGKEGHYQVNLIPDKDLEGRVLGFYLMTFNITALKEAELRQAESENRLRTITDNLPALIMYIDREEKVAFANATYREWLGIEPSEVLGRPFRDVVGADMYLARQAMIDRALAGERVEFEDRTRARGADRITRISYVPDIDADGSTLGIFSLCLDITALKVVERQLTELARLDTLTGLPNRLAFNEFLPAAILRAQRTGSAIALMFLDIDGFKAINDTFGHASGDSVLAEYARRLLAGVRSTDTVARLAGDEFVVVLENLRTQEAAAAVASKLLEQVSASAFRCEGRPLQVTTSIGVAFHPASGAFVTAEQLLARADAALYGAKSSGRNRFEFSV